jgi:hypothetical protein
VAQLLLLLFEQCAHIHITQLPRGEPSFLVSIPFFLFSFPKLMAHIIQKKKNSLEFTEANRLADT